MIGPVGPPMEVAEERIYRFGPYRLDVRTRELRQDGAPVALTAKAFDVLCVLVGNRERVVGRDELLATVWAGRVVEENNLTQAIAALRRAFGTTANDRDYILTVPGRGYRFVATVREGDADLDPLPDGAHRVVAPTTSAPRRGPALAVGGVLLAVAAVLAWWWVPGGRSERWERSAPSADGLPGPTVADAPVALAVLPFRPLSGAPVDEDRMLALGLADTLITRISNAPGLRVRSFGSSERLGSGERDPRETARLLGVAYVVEGTTQRQGDRVRVNARLRAADGRALWSDSFDAGAEDVFMLQDRISAGLARALDIRLAAPLHRSPCDGADATAYRAYLSGQYRLSRPRGDLALQAMDDFRRALDLDPTCARAHAAMAQAYRVRVVTADTDPRVDFARARRLVDRALALDPHLAEAHLAQGWIAFWHDWDWAASEAAFRRAIDLNPSLADAHFGLAHLLSNTGRDAEAAASAREAMALDPLSPVINAIGAWMVAPPQEAVRQLDRALELDPDYWLGLLMRGAVRIRTGDRERGMADLSRAQSLCGDCSHTLAVRGVVEARAGNVAAARRILEQMEARHRAGYWPASATATLHAALGEPAKALDLLERAWHERDLRMAFLRVDEPMRWHDLRREPRYRALYRRMGFDEAPAEVSGRTHTPASAHTSAADRGSR